MLWLGWFGFNAGSSLHADGQAIKAFLNTNTASATAMMTWIFFDCLRGRKPSAMGAAVGCVVGLVAITPSAGYVTVGQSIFIAFVITLICNVAVYWVLIPVLTMPSTCSPRTALAVSLVRC